MKTSNVILSLIAAISLGMVEAAKPPYFLLVGDSTVAPNGGWGDALLSYITGAADGQNKAKSGTTTFSWKANGRWGDLLDEIEVVKADYEPIVTIQFGHNDQKGMTLDEYRANLVNITTELISLGATPIIITSLTRRAFEDGEVIQNLHEWRGKAIAAAKSAGVKWLDLNLASTDYVNAIGEGNAQYYNLDGTDRTHLSPAGGVVFGRMTTDLLLEKRPDLAQYFESNQNLSDKIWNGEFATGEE